MQPGPWDPRLCPLEPDALFLLFCVCLLHPADVLPPQLAGVGGTAGCHSSIGLSGASLIHLTV